MSAMTPIQIVHDLYCWHCCAMDTTLNCSKCPRSFHMKCETPIESDATQDANWICSVCKTVNDSQNVNTQEDRNIVPILINKVYKGKMFKLLKFSLVELADMKFDGADFIVNPMNLTKIHGKSDSYTSIHELYVDFQWILHNCMILFSENDGMTIAARSLLSYIDEQIASIKECAECYLKSFKYPKRWFTMLCTKPHLIVWAKIVDFSYWPAKVMSVDGQHVNVRFFGADAGDQTYAATSCYLYSKTSPKTPQIISPEYDAALEEANLYIKNIIKKYGSFVFAETKTAFDTELVNDYVDQVIPGFLQHEKEAEMLKVESEESEDVNSAKDLQDDVISLDDVDGVEIVDSQQHDGSLLHQSVRYKEPMISFARFDDPHVKEDIDQEQISSEVNDGPPRKKVRFSDEFGEELTQVRIIEPTEDEFGSDYTDVDVTDEVKSEELVTLTEENDAEEILADTFDETNDETQHNIGFSDDEDNVEVAQNIEIPENAQNTEVEVGSKNVDDPNQQVNLIDFSSRETHTYQRIVQNMKGIQGDLLNSIHMSQLKSEALQNTKEAHAKEVAALQANIDALLVQLQTATNERDQAIQRVNDCKEEHTKELAVLNETHNRTKTQIEKLKNNEIQLKVQLAEMKGHIESIFADKAVSEAQLKQKYLEIVNNIRKDADRELKNKSKCKGCSQTLVFCGQVCEQFWNTWKNPNPDEDNDPNQT